MSSADRPFSTFVRDHRPLVAALEARLRPLESELRLIHTVAALDMFVAEELDGFLRSAPPEVPVLGGMRAARVDEPDNIRAADGKNVLATRHYVALQVRGDPELLMRWPRESDDLKPADSPDWPDTGLKIKNTNDMWELSLLDYAANPGSWALYTYVDLTIDEEAAAADGKLDLTQLFAERRARIEPIVERIRAQTTDYFANSVPELVSSYVARKRHELEIREGVTASLSFPAEWSFPPLAVEDAATVPAPLYAAEITDLVAPHTPRLAPVSFQNLQSTIRVWADAVERYPNTFSKLTEDQVSDLLAATLNATMPAAHREVYSRNGKSDIFVHADTLAEGSGPARIFIAEAKWTTSSKTVREALDPQLFGYLTASDTAAVLLLFVPQGDREAAIDRYTAELRTVTGFEEEEASAVQGWPVFVYRHEMRTVRVCLAWIHLARASRPSRSRRGLTQVASDI